MADMDIILMRRMGVRKEKVKTGWFGHELRVALDGECEDTEVLCAVGKDGTNPRCVNSDKHGFFNDCQPPADNELLFAIRRKFYFNTSISAGRDSDGFEWFFDVGGMLEIVNPAAFTEKLCGIVEDGKSLSATAFWSLLGTIPSTVMHDKVTMEVLGVTSLEDKGSDGQYADLQKRLEAERGVGERFVGTAMGDVFSSFFGAENIVRLDVKLFHVRSPMREDAIALEEQNRVAAIEAKKAEETLKRQEDERRKENERIKRENESKREEELNQKKHELELAELEAQKAKLKSCDASSAYAAFETLSNVLGDTVQNSGAGSFVDLLKCAQRGESGLRLLAMTRDKKCVGGVTLKKSTPSFQTRGFSFTTTKTPALHHGDSLSSTIINGRRDGCLMILNVSERNEIIPLLPNADFPDVRIARGEQVLVGDDASAYIPNIWENATSGTDHLVAIVSDAPLLSSPLPPLGEALSVSSVSELISKLETLNADEWSADVVSFTILP